VRCSHSLSGVIRVVVRDMVVVVCMGARRVRVLRLLTLALSALHR